MSEFTDKLEAYLIGLRNEKTYLIADKNSMRLSNYKSHLSLSERFVTGKRSYEKFAKLVTSRIKGEETRQYISLFMLKNADYCEKDFMQEVLQCNPDLSELVILVDITHMFNMWLAHVPQKEQAQALFKNGTYYSHHSLKRTEDGLSESLRLLSRFDFSKQEYEDLLREHIRNSSNILFLWSHTLIEAIETHITQDKKKINDILGMQLLSTEIVNAVANPVTTVEILLGDVKDNHLPTMKTLEEFLELWVKTFFNYFQSIGIKNIAYNFYHPEEKNYDGFSRHLSATLYLHSASSQPVKIHEFEICLACALQALKEDPLFMNNQEKIKKVLLSMTLQHQLKNRASEKSRTKI